MLDDDEFPMPIEQTFLTKAWDETAEKAKAHYEETAVNKLMSHFKLRPQFVALAKEIHHEWERPVGFPDLHERYPGFPRQLGVSSRLFGLVDLDLAELFKRFTKTPIYVAYADLMDTLDVSRVGMVFEWPRLAKWVVIHNYPRDLESPHPVFLRHVAQLKCQVAIETFDSFLAGVHWEPDV